MVADLSYEPARVEDLEELVALRLEAMRDSLLALARPCRIEAPERQQARSRERFVSGFDPAQTRHIMVAGQRVGFVVVKRERDALLLDHLYLRPGAQGRGVGGAVLAQVGAEADALGLPLTLGALRGSRSNAFYLKHGFSCVGESEWDLYYRREPR